VTPAITPLKRKLDATNARIAAKSECDLPMRKNRRNIWSVRSIPRSGIEKLRRKDKMVTRDDLEQLVKNRGQEAVGAAVVKIPDEDVRPALMLMVMIYQKSDEINRELFRRDQKRIAELEEELKKARAELHQLKQEQ
jgi:hypothetical protein